MAQGCVPVVVVPHALGLDQADARFGDGGRKRSGFRLLQEFLNASDPCLWGIVGNGSQLRLVRDNPSLTRPAYLEVDFARLFAEESYADFSALWLILHASRFPRAGEALEDCVLEVWRSSAREEGARARDQLRDGVTHALLAFGEGFLQHRANEALRERLTSGELSQDAYFQQLLRLVYRLIFWFTIEDRGLMHPADTPQNARELYRQGYASAALRKRALRAARFDRHADRWHAVRVVFRGLAAGQPALGLPALGGLFGEHQCPDLDAAELSNRHLLAGIRALAWFAHENVLTPVNWRAMQTEEFGSVYESLLELVPEVDVPNRRFDFPGLDAGGTRGNARKLTGSYYTPDALVQELLKTALDPVIERTITENEKSPVEALLKLAVIDPACGSGHFLLAAAHHIADWIARLSSEDGNPSAEDHRRALRQVVTHCLYGVDRNPMALELARTALWLEAFTPDAPLGFIDHHLICGDALVGLTHFDVLKAGIPNAAFKALTGDDKDVCKQLAATNRAELKSWARAQQQKGLDFGSEQAREALEWLDASGDDTLEAIAEKRAAFERLQTETADSPLARAADLYMAAFLSSKTGDQPVPTTGDMARALLGDPVPEDMLNHARAVTARSHVLHWPLAFAQVMARGGFDVILGNPPWEVSQLSEEEFFAPRDTQVAGLSGAKRKTAIAALEQANPMLWQQYVEAKFGFESVNAFHRSGGRLSLVNSGKLNTYALFAETAYRLIASRGRAGLVVPTGIATDDSTKAFFGEISQSGRLAALMDFENREKVFPAVDSRVKFCLLTLGAATEAAFTFFATQVAQLADPERRFTLSPEDLRRLNPNTRTCAVFRSRADAELTRKIYRRVPVLWQEQLKDAEGNLIQSEVNPWGLRFKQGLFNMTSASHLFESSAKPDHLRLYEAKMIHQFDHRWASYSAAESPEVADCTVEQKADPNFAVRPRYWVHERHVLARLAELPKDLCKAYADQPDKAPRMAALWLIGAELSAGKNQAEAERAVAGLAAWLPADSCTPDERKQALKMAQAVPPTDADHTTLTSSADADEALHALFDARSPRWLMGWRDICRATDERTVIAAAFPRVAVGHTMPLVVSTQARARVLALQANLLSMPLDYIARLKVGGTHLTYGYLKQLPVLPPDAYSPAALKFIATRALELTYTSHDLRPLYDEVIAEYPALDTRTGADRGRPFGWDEARRAQLRAELDASFARLYGLTRDELRYILDPADVKGADYPSETFRTLRDREIKTYGEYRTRRLVLEAWDAQQETNPS